MERRVSLRGSAGAGRVPRCPVPCPGEGGSTDVAVQRSLFGCVGCAERTSLFPAAMKDQTMRLPCSQPSPGRGEPVHPPQPALLERANLSVQTQGSLVSALF